METKQAKQAIQVDPQVWGAIIDILSRLEYRIIGQVMRRIEDGAAQVIELPDPQDPPNGE